MTETLEYELIEISFSFGYDLEREGPVSMCLHDDSTIIGNEPKQGDRNQKGFEQILVMTYEDPMLGTIKLTVGVKRQSKEKVQYGITAMREGQALVNPDLVIHSKKKGQKKKAHR